MRHPAIDDMGPWHSPPDRAQAGLHLRRHPGGQTRQQPLQLIGGHLGQQAGSVRPVGVEPLNVGEHDELLGAQRDGQCRCSGVSVDVVHHAVGVRGQSGYHRNAPGVDDVEHCGGVHCDHIADQPHVDLLAVHGSGTPDGGEQLRVLAGEPNSEWTVRVDHPDELAAYLTEQDHSHDVDRLFGGDPQSSAELPHHAQAVQHGADLGPATVHHDWAKPSEPQKDHVLGERVLELILQHRAAAVLDHDGGPVEALQPGQRFGEHLGFMCRCLDLRRHDEYALFSSTYPCERSVVSTVACPSPRCRSISTVMSRPDRSAFVRSAATVPPRQSSSPLIRISSVPAVTVAAEAPTAAAIRPQLASEPKKAVLTRLSRATARAARIASASLAAPQTVIAISLVTPSASACKLLTSWWHTRCTAAVNSARSGITPDAPDASSRTVSLVEQVPSMSRRSKVSVVAERNTASKVTSSTAASVVSTHSMVAKPGATMPAPLANPPTIQPVPATAACLGTVSVVSTAVAAARPASGVAASAAAALSTPESTASIGSRSPISPVEQTATSTAPQSSTVATRSAVTWVSWNPLGPVHALAPPEFSATARSRRPVRTCADHSTGAALT